MKGDLGRIDSLGTHILLGKNLCLSYGAGMNSVLLLQGSNLRILDRNGLSATEVELPNAYLRIAERDGYYVAMGTTTVDLIDKKSAKVIKSIPVVGSCLDLALNPQKKIAYVAVGVAGLDGASGKQIQMIDETDGTARKLEKVFGNRLVVDPTGKFLYTTLNEFRSSDIQIMGTYGDFATLSQYQSIDILLSYELGDKTAKFKQSNIRPGENGQALRMAPDGGCVSYIAGGGYRSGSPELSGYTIPAFDLTNITAARIAYSVGPYPTDVSYHPTLPLVAGSNGEEVKIFERKTGAQLSGKVDFKGEVFGREKLSRVFFAPGGMHLLVAYVNRNGGWLLRSFPINLTEPERSAASKPLILAPPAKTTAGTPSTPAVSYPAVPLAKLDSLGAPLPDNERSAKDIAKMFGGSVVLIETSSGSGTGFVVGSSGYILTCNHVLGDGMMVGYESIQGNGMPARLRSKEVVVVRTDPARDLALLLIKPIGALKPVHVSVGKSTLATGDKVYVIGNPGLGDRVLDSTMTEGIISNPNRDIDGIGFIQTTAAVNPGSSGSPLFSNNGQVIGMITLKATIEATGFAVPRDGLVGFLRSCAELSVEPRK